MGCDNSKTDSADEEEDFEHADEFSDHHVDSIKSTWPILTRDRLLTGSNLFRHIFLVEPSVKQLFQTDRYFNQNRKRGKLKLVNFKK